MPRHKQPYSLGELALQTVEKLIRDVGNNLIRNVCTATPRIICEETSDLNAELYDVYWLHQMLHSNLPNIFADELTRHAFIAIREIVEHTECMSYLFAWDGDRKCRCIIEDMIECTLHPQIRIMDFLEWPKFMWLVLCKNLHKLKRLEVLKLHSSSACDSEMKDFIEHDICLLKNLVSFAYKGGCSDKIMYQVGNNCEKLQILDVSLSARLTDNSIQSILKLQELRKLDVSCTNLSEEGCFQLLTSLRNLESYACSKLSMPWMMVDLCPNLTQVSLSYVTCDLSTLGQLANLKDLSLSRCNCLVTNLNGLLQIKGQDLIILQLNYVWNADINSITTYCTRLKKLTWEVYTFTDNEPIEVRGAVTPHYCNLEHLDITNFSPLNLNFQPFNYLNIKILKVHFFGDICDDLVFAAVSKNFLRQLIELRLYNCGFLSLKTVRLLLDHCPHLRILAGLTTWRGISGKELENFHIELKANNIDICVE
ncbi:hypothetical protein C0J52_09632 [Blattella germanica]|nr:hypothetical protein C0J52_09632 [Blattella germanica]